MSSRTSYPMRITNDDRITETQNQMETTTHFVIYFAYNIMFNALCMPLIHLTVCSSLSIVKYNVRSIHLQFRSHLENTKNLFNCNKIQPFLRYFGSSVLEMHKSPVPNGKRDERQTDNHCILRMKGKNREGNGIIFHPCNILLKLKRSLFIHVSTWKTIIDSMMMKWNHAIQHCVK